MPARRRSRPQAEVFIDTGFVIALLDEDDAFHARALRWAKHFDGRYCLTTTAVLLECGDGFANRSTWKVLHPFLADLRADPAIEVVAVDTALLDRAITLRQKNLARKWGLTDCLSFVVMKERGITEALSSDSDYNEAGFDALLLRT